MYLKKLTIFIIYNQYNIQLSLDAGCKKPKLEFATLLNTIISSKFQYFWKWCLYCDKAHKTRLSEI